MRTARIGLALICIAPLLSVGLAGCGCTKLKKAAKAGAEAARMAHDARDGDFTVKTEDGEEVHVTTEGDDGDGTAVIEGPDGQTITIESDGDSATWTAEGEDGKTEMTFDQEENMATVTDAEGVTRTYETGDDAASEDDIGLEFYPGAKVTDGTKTSSTDGTTFAMAILHTPDSVDKVKKFYRGKYADGATVYDSGDTMMIQSAQGTADSKQIIVGASKDGGGTEITLMSGQPG